MKALVQIPDYKQFERKIRRLKGAISAQKFMGLVAMHHLSEMRPRIMRGITVDGGGFPPYSTKAFYVSQKTPGMRTLIKPMGKYGEKRFPNGHRHTSRYFAGGYAQFRQHIGLSNSNRLSLRGKMLAAMTVSPYRGGAQIAFSRKQENLKAAGNEKRYHFWGFTRDERKSNRQYAKQLFQNTIRKTVKSNE